MTVDNTIYNRPGDIWWDEHQPLNTIRTALNPARLVYFAQAFRDAGVDPAGKTAVDVGCGGGLMAEEIARLGATVIGVDPSSHSLDTARAHARLSGLHIDYRHGTGEALPIPDESADIVYCVDVLEHVADIEAVIRETTRVLRPGGLYVFDTINRTRQSRLVMIKLFQEWTATAWMPENLHDWHQFITPHELRTALMTHGLQPRTMTGMGPAVSKPALLRLLRQLKNQRLTCGEFGDRASFTLTNDLRITYIGHAVKPTPAPA
jgi:2-polyprenyl-6-hydroxyphenyl methylase/3-demethylubiquinone-9 3-methyltransferase